MLYLKPPYALINGVTLFSDHADPRTFYFLPLSPRISRVEDPATGQRVPQLQLIKYRGSAGSGGFLNFDVDLGVDDLDEIADELRRMLRLRDRPVLVPAPLIDGEVKMMLFGKQSGDLTGGDGAGGEGEGGEAGESRPEFVLKIDHNAKPSLYGDNRAAFSVALDEYGVTVLEKALEGEMTPIGIVYSLRYLGLRPAYTVQLKADWSRVQKHFEESFGVDTPIFSSQIDTAVDKLIEDRVIEIEVDQLITEDEDPGGVIDRMDQAVAQVREMVTDAFFQPSLEPEKEKPDGWDKAAGFVERISRVGATGGMGGDALFSYKKVDYTRIDKKSLNVRFNERIAVQRSIYPQGHLSGLFRTLSNEGLDPAGFILQVEADDPWFARRKLRVASKASFDEDDISYINVSLRYGDQPRNLLLESSTDSKELEWPSRVTGGEMERAVTASYEVAFKGADRNDRPLKLQSPPQVVDGDVFPVQPRELYSLRTIKILALAFPWETYPNVEVHTRYTDEANDLRADESFILDKDHTETSWKLFVLDPEKTVFEHKLIFHAADHRNVEWPWTPTELEQVVVKNPFPRSHKVEVGVSGSVWADAERVYVDVAYEDEENGIFENESFKFKADEEADQTFRVDLADPEHRLVTYTVTFMLQNGSVVEVPKSMTRARRIFVTRGMKGHRLVEVRPAAVDFSSKKVREMTVELQHESPEESANDRFTFRSREDVGHFEFNYSDASESTYRYRVSSLFTNGLTRETDWKETNDDKLVLPVG